MVKMHTLYGIGVGPGDPEFLTIKGYRALRKAHKIFVPVGKDGNPGIAYNIVKPYISEETEVIGMDFPMIDLKENQNALKEKWEENAITIKKALEKGDVVFLTLGDPFVFSTYSYILDYLKDYEMDVETIPGISSFSGIASRLNIPLTQGDQSFAVVSLSKDEENIREIIKLHNSIVIMKVSLNPELLYQILKEENLENNFILVTSVSTDKEEIITDIEALTGKIPYMSTMLINKDRFLNGK